MIIRLIIAIYLNSIYILTSVFVIFPLLYWQINKLSVGLVQKQPTDPVTEPELSSPAGSPVVPRKHTAALPAPSLEAEAPADPWNTHNKSSRKPSIMTGASRSKLSAVRPSPLALRIL